MAPRDPSVKEFALALSLSTVFTVALFYTTFEAPVLLDRVLHQYFPEVFYDVEAIEGVLSVLRPVGYAALAATIVLTILGFTIRKSILASLGSLVLYIPTFGYFAYAMFFLTGIGVLRALWLPLLELSPSTLKLGCIAYLPFSIIPQAPLIGLVITFIGLFVFLLGVTTWLYGRFKGYEIVDFWIYRYSRHPQYLGFILWSLGLLVFVSNKVYVRGAFTTPPALIWLTSTMLVVGIALTEEIEMRRKHGEKYEEYCRKTPFMIPLPGVLSRAITAPLKLTGGYPRSTREIAFALTLYTAMLITISYILMLMSLC
ncbi:MAG: DUF1295 domain-containing protein [Desulfurococcaceae archaeon]